MEVKKIWVISRKEKYKNKNHCGWKDFRKIFLNYYVYDTNVETVIRRPYRMCIILNGTAPNKIEDY